MTDHLTTQCVEIKAVLAGLQQFKITSTARIVALLAACGVTKASDVSALSGVCERMVRKAMKELDAAKRNHSSTDSEPEFRNQSSENGTRVPKTEPEFRSRARIVTNKPSLLGEVSNNKTPLPPKRGASPFDCLQAFEAYNDLALRVGIPQAAKLTPDRQRKISARLKDYGADGWQQALANIERSSFLTGTNDRGWTASLDFLVQPASFSKVHDGGYGNGRHAKTERKAWDIPSRPAQPDDQAWMDSLAEKYA